MQVSILSGVVTNQASEFGLSYPLNLEPLIVKSGISQGQLRGAVGASSWTTGSGVDRGGIVWNGVHYRVMGPTLVKVDTTGAINALGEVGGSGPVGLDYSFDRLFIRSSGKLFYWNGAALSQVTDPDLGTCVDAIWVDGYTMSTDGTYVAVSELNDPASFKTTRYGSAEADPDPVTGLIRAAGEVYVLGRHTIQVLDNQGGSGFPFVVVKGATIQTGCVSATAKVALGNSFAFVGSNRGEALGVFVAGQGTANRISTRRIEDALSAEPNPEGIVLERRVGRDEVRLYVHLTRETWCFLATASQAAGEPVWYRLQSGIGQPYRLRNAVLVGNDFIVGDSASPQLGRIETRNLAHFGEQTQWGFDAGLLFNESKGAIVDRVELTGLPGGEDDLTGNAVFMSMTRDGETYSPERVVTMAGRRTKRIQWRPHARMRNYMGLRFRGYGSALPGFAACQIEARPLAV